MQKVTKAVIPAAGLGTRFLPITKVIPKPMLSVLDKPTVQYIVEELKSVGITDVMIVVSPNSEIIKKHFGKAEKLEERLLSDGKKELYEILKDTQKFNVKFATQKTANGLAGAILCAEEFVKEEPFALLLGDELLYAEKGETPCIKRLVDVYEKTGKTTISTMQVFGDDVSKYGNLGIGDEKDGIMEINDIIEKPSINDALSNYAIIGRYVLSGEVMQMLKTLKPRNNEIYLTDAFKTLAKKGELVASEFEGKRFDVGDKAGYVKANIELALKNDETKDDIKEFIKEIYSRLNK